MERQQIMKKLDFKMVAYPTGIIGKGNTIIFWVKDKVPYSSAISDTDLTKIIVLSKT